MTRALLPRRAVPFAAMRARPGITLVELIVTLVIVTIIGGAFMRTMVHQSRFFDAKNTERQARGVSRGAVNVMLGELRMVTVPGGLIAASRDTIVVRVPYAFGVLCGSSAVASTISTVPMDSLAYAEGGAAGYAWRDSTGNYTYQNASFTMAPGLATSCIAASITTLPGGKVVTVTPAVPAAAVVGTPVMLYRRVGYAFAESTLLPGRRALWRRNLAAGTSEELVAPFDATTRFRFIVDDSTASQPLPPAALGTVRGIEVRLKGASDRAAVTTGEPAIAELRAAVFFMNRLP